ncbi:MAG: hypothetical protein PHO26_11145 [Dehalococcoidia bacterium]|nr:hypothetical protein [Dehalococcoidia bacterium]MDD5493599.1 hypothetical protein [Dehalococcoidia bacterium]
MDTQVIGGIIGIACLGFVCIGTFLLVPDRELKVRERIGIHSIFWAFIIYAVWTINTLVQGQSLDKYFYLSLPILLGLMISLLAEYKSKQPPVNVSDTRLKKIIDDTWNRLPTSVKRDLQNTVMNIIEVSEWSYLDREGFGPVKRNAAKWTQLIPMPARGFIHISSADCKDLSDTVITGAIAHEFAHAYQSSKTPFVTEKIDEAGDTLPVKWSFKKEIAELIKQREADQTGNA